MVSATSVDNLAEPGGPPWFKSYPPGMPHEIDMRCLQALDAVILQSCASFGDRRAFSSFGSDMDYRSLRERAEMLVCALQAHGLKKGDHIGLMLPNIMAYPVLLAGLLIGGYVVVSTNPLYTARELEHQMKDAEVKAVFVFESCASVLAACRPTLDLKLAVIVKPGDFLGLKGRILNFAFKSIKKMVPAYSLPDAMPLKDFIRRGAGKRMQPVAIALDDIAFLQYTGGTTGVSKGAVLSHRNISANLEQCLAWCGPFVMKTAPSEGPCMVAALPLYHIYGLTCCALLMLRLGGSCLLIANPRDISGFIKILKNARFSTMNGVNTLFNALMNAPGFTEINFDQVTHVFAGGMALQAAVAERWQKLTKLPIIEGYGLSETAPALTGNRADITAFNGTVGLPLPSTEIAILTPEGRAVPIGERGEICARGPQVMQGYWKRSDETAKVMTADGFFRTGDVGIMQEDGSLRIVDRLKDMILVSGFNVYPNEVESVIATHPAVLEVGVVGVPDAAMGEAVVAYVVRRDDSLTEEILKAFCKESLTGYKCPRAIYFRHALPKTNVGKVLRRLLRDETMQGG
jgi:long-chain acyl-CoA synthetase